MAGTSMATPVVAGVLAVEWSRQRGKSGEEIWKEVRGKTTNDLIERLPKGSQNRLVYLNNGIC
jgi:subtilisin family serine protease